MSIAEKENNSLWSSVAKNTRSLKMTSIEANFARNSTIQKQKQKPKQMKQSTLLFFYTVDLIIISSSDLIMKFPKTIIFVNSLNSVMRFSLFTQIQVIHNQCTDGSKTEFQWPILQLVSTIAYRTLDERMLALISVWHETMLERYSVKKSMWSSHVSTPSKLISTKLAQIININTWNRLHVKQKWAFSHSCGEIYSIKTRHRH